ncbi:hypothetical protein CONLIGDRAFT_686498 [Coniochaeta ligniaria NRRL 30616]|uniref:Uncharacterized protein n=1 Tax=Coniochaeta ligniaria NRRL 30616 TaxID=1408157 RepID=A0A1J7J7S9_9PEZI|nr:hypothetical protein CONLIGDRAFT_686498 [Coniochaeta ligniaria NRRL 30616]
MNAPISSPTTSSQQTSFASTRQSSTDKIAPPPPRQTHSPSTDPFLRDFTLVAEAAKRAQMAVSGRGDVEQGEDDGPAQAEATCDFVGLAQLAEFSNIGNGICWILEPVRQRSYFSNTAGIFHVADF